MLDSILCAAARRYRLPRPPDLDGLQEAAPATVLAVTIEAARLATGRHEIPGDTLESLFTEALARLIHAALRPQGGDAVFQAMVLRHQSAQVREYASLSAHAQRDRRNLHNAVNAIAHPARQQQLPAGPLRDALARLQASAHAADWPALADAVQGLLALPDATGAAALADKLARLRDTPELPRLLRQGALAADPQVRQYQALWN
ncbi:3-deoxy-D-arabino-heptulosonate 7-phosphate synthase, partial [Bordetella petrii]|nr:3-deoxy-D-arabino-heptulosonate 7-phosphate synthase [Bordetella petrii]